jgi:hypothetical protein
MNVLAVVVFTVFVLIVLGLSFFFARRARSSSGYYTAGGSIHWSVNGISFAGDYLSAASFLGICGMIATVGYDGFLYSIGYLAGWIVALFVVAEPLKRLGKFTFSDALDAKFGSRGIRLIAALSTLIVSVFYLIPQMVGAGTLVTPLLGLPHYAGVIMVGLIVIVSGLLHPFEPAVVSIGQIHGGFTENVIPEKVELSGTMRFTSEASRLKIEAEMRRAFELTRALGGDYQLKFVFGCPPLVNHASAADLIHATAVDLLGAEAVHPIPPTLGAEDFGAFIETVPGAMFTLGTLIEGDERTLHHPRFDIDERAMPIGMALLAETALRFLRGHH